MNGLAQAHKGSEMETIKEHTETPWVALHDPGNPVGIQWCVRAKAGYFIADCMDNASDAGPVGEANAAFIVKAVNSHDELLKALEAVCDMAEQSIENITDEEQKVIDIARAALDQAGAQ